MHAPNLIAKTPLITTVSAPDPSTEAASQPEAASAFSASDLCDECVRHDGLCRRHEKSILPQLAQPGWIRLIVSNYGAPTPPSPEAQKLIARQDRRRARRMRDLEFVLKSAAA